MMEEQPSRRPASYHNCLTTIIALVISAMIVGIPCWFVLHEKSDEMTQGSHARQIYHLLNNWAVENEGYLPDHGLGPDATANEAFRRLFKDGFLLDETVFSGIRSPYVGDKDTGSPPDFTQAFAAGENHWMLVGGLNMKSSPRSTTPLLFENAMTSTWPPIWKDGWFMSKERGRSWRGKIMVIYMDGSSQMVPLIKTPQGLTLPDTAYPAEWKTHPPKILDVED